MGRKQKDSLKNILSSYGFPCFHKEEYSHSNDDNSQYSIEESCSVASYIPTMVCALRVVKNQSQFSNDASRETIPASAKIPCTIYCPVIV